MDRQHATCGSHSPRTTWHKGDTGLFLPANCKQEQQPSSTSCCISAKTPFPKGTTGASLWVTPCEAGPRAWRSQTLLLGFEPNLAIMNPNVMVHQGHCARSTYT